MRVNCEQRKETLDSARSLTGARYGVIVLVTGQQDTAEFLSSGMTPEHAGELERPPNKWELFEYLFGIEEPLRLPGRTGDLERASAVWGPDQLGDARRMPKPT